MNNEENKDLAQHKDEVAKVAPNASNEDVSNENTQEISSEVSVNPENTTENVVETVSVEFVSVETVSGEFISVETVSVEIIAEKQAEEAHQNAPADTHKDYSHLSKEEILALVVHLHTEKTLSNNEVQKNYNLIRQIKPVFDEIVNHERAEELKKFIAEGGVEMDFHFHQDEITKKFYNVAGEVRKQHHANIQNAENNKAKNLKAKQDLLENLRNIISGQETENTLQQVKQLQKDWKAVGEVPQANSNELWKSYTALMDIYYSNVGISRELKELDQKKNLDTKIEICQKAEALATVSNERFRNAIKELNILHEEYKHVGPVPKEDKEPLWERFKIASDVLYARKREIDEVQRGEILVNLNKKIAVLDRILPFKTYQGATIKEWNETTQDVLAIQKEWDTTGFVPREKAAEVTKNFWAGLKTFFKNKSDFFAKLDAVRQENLDKKTALCVKVEELVANVTPQTTEETAKILKKLQDEWKTIGAVPEKQRNTIYDRFKAGLDKFFEARRNQLDSKDIEFKGNLDAKNEVITRIEALDPAQLAGVNGEELISKFIAEFKAIGFVPIKLKEKVQEKFHEALTAMIAKIEGISANEKDGLAVNMEIRLAGGDGSVRSLERKEEAVRKRIFELEDEISTLNNNLGFFANSKNANEMKATFDERIKAATKDLENFKKQLKQIRTAIK